MTRKSKFTNDERIKIVKDFILKNRSMQEICNDEHICKVTLYNWVNRYKLNGEKGLEFSDVNSSYTKEFKEMVVSEFEKKNITYNEIALKYGIPSRSLVQEWVHKKENDEYLNNYKVEKEVVYGRKTTLDERKEIVEYCLSQNKNYNLTKEVYRVSYTQIYHWVKNYEQYGDEGLKDGRGRKKTNN